MGGVGEFYCSTDNQSAAKKTGSVTTETEWPEHTNNTEEHYNTNEESYLASSNISADIEIRYFCTQNSS